ncbi:hypothetical protein [Halolamina sediminis]|jgi:hypothetical protein|uniref:hypothetical protein n=1 Tax=Halolamina sediminis TaxID=1480675 RepID=UPI0006B4717C|nr:hypothetical protein [Halolamina sediminis]
MPDPDAVARALARLADGSHRRHGTDDTEPERTVAEAETAIESVDSAAAFVDDDGEAALRRAVDVAENAGDDGLAARGRAVLTTLDAFRDAATGGDERPADDGRTTSTPLAQPSSREGA